MALKCTLLEEGWETLVTIAHYVLGNTMVHHYNRIFCRKLHMHTITSSSVSLGKILACLSALRSVTLPIPLLSNILKIRPCRPLMYILPFLDAHLAVLRCTSCHRSTPSD